MNDKLIKNGTLVLFIGIALVIIFPLILTLEKISFISFKDTGDIGDTIGGITSPITSIIGSILVYFALKAQIDANIQIQKQLKKQDEEKALSDKINFINNRINLLKEEINGFYYSYKRDEKDQKVINYKGSQAIFQLLNRNKSECKLVKLERTIYEVEPKFVELKSLLDYFSDTVIFIDKEDFKNSKNDLNKVQILEIKKPLFYSLKYYFDAKIKGNFDFFKIGNEYHYGDCDGSCNLIGGLPKDIVEIVKKIETKLNGGYKKSLFDN